MSRYILLEGRKYPDEERAFMYGYLVGMSYTSILWLIVTHFLRLS